MPKLPPLSQLCSQEWWNRISESIQMTNICQKPYNECLLECIHICPAAFHRSLGWDRHSLTPRAHLPARPPSILVLMLR